MRLQGEPFGKFEKDLRLPSQSCSLGELTDSVISDKIVIGIRDIQFRKRLLEQPDLKLEKAIGMCEAAEISQTKMKSLEGKPGAEMTEKLICPPRKRTDTKQTLEGEA